MISYRQPNKLVLSAMALAIATPAMVITVDEVQASTVKEFSDVSKQNAYYDTIKMMAASNIINGYEDGTFRPNQSISRKHAAALVGRAIDLSEVVELDKSVAVPKDLSTKNPYYKDILMFVQAGLLTVDAKGNVNPEKELTRGEMAKILAVAFELKGTKHSLKDVSKSVEPYVAALYENNVTTGYEDGTFKEKQSLSRAHYAVFMYRAMGNSAAFAENVTITKDSTAEDVNRFLVSSPLVNTEKVSSYLNNQGVSSALAEGFPMLREYLGDMDEILEGTDLKLASVLSGYLAFEEDNWVNKDKQSYLGRQVNFDFTQKDKFLKTSFDYTIEDSVTVTKRLLDKTVPTHYGIDVNHLYEIMDKKIVEANNNFADKTFDNGEVVYMNGYQVNVGVFLIDNSKTFSVTITKP